MNTQLNEFMYTGFTQHKGLTAPFILVDKRQLDISRLKTKLLKHMASVKWKK